MIVQLLIDRLWEKCIPMNIIGKCTGLAFHPDDQMSPVHRRIFQLYHPHLSRTMKQLDAASHLRDPAVQPFAYIGRRHRIRLAVQVNQAALIHLAGLKPKPLQAGCTYPTQRQHLISPGITACCIASPHHLINKHPIVILRLKVTTTTKRQRHFQVLTKMTMTHLHTAILVRFPDVDCPGCQPIMIQHTLKPLIEDPLLPVYNRTMRYHRAVIQLKTRRQTTKIQRHLIDKRFQRCKALTSAHTHMLNR
jgi:hypothetical protein